MKLYVVELWVTHNMQEEVLEDYDIFLSLEDAQQSCITGYAMNEDEYFRRMDSNGACRLIVIYDMGE